MNKKEFIGGKGVIDRIQQAYGFAKRKDLGEHLGISPSTFSTWVARDFFPAELVIRCVAETGSRLEFVAFGEEPIFNDLADMKYFHALRIENGETFIMGQKGFLKSLLPVQDSRESYEKIFCVMEGAFTYFATTEYKTLIDGLYFIKVDNSALIRYVSILPQGRVRVDGGKFSFECAQGDIEIIGRVILKMEKV